MAKEKTVLIRGGSVIDGTGANEQRLDVFVRGDSIVELGKFPIKKADTVIDATGMIVAPGFWDVNTESDHYLSIFTDPFQKSFLSQGVTSIVGGLHGASLAPVLRGSLDSIRKWTDTNQVNIDWGSFFEFFALLERRGIGVNFSSFVGYSTLRRAVSSDLDRDLDENQMDKLKRLASESIEDGALGISLGLFHRDHGSVSSRELEEIFRLSAGMGTLVAVQCRYDGENVYNAVEEVAHFANKFEVKTLINTFVCVKGHEKEYARALELVQESKYLFLDLHTFDHQTLPIHMLLPAEFRFGGAEKMLDILKSDHGREVVLESLGRVAGEKIIIANAPDFDFLVGRSLKEFAANQGLSVARALVKLMEMTKLMAVVFVENLNSQRALEVLVGDKAFFASANPSLLSTKNIVDHPGGGIASFSRYLADSENLEFSIRKITKNVCDFLGVEDRGVLAPGYKADIVLLSDRKVRYVLMNGDLTLENGNLTNSLDGVTIKWNE